MTPTLASMTGFSRASGTGGGLTWAWELRSVNGRGLELRFRLPPGFDAQEPGLRDAAGKVLKRGNVSAGLTITREQRAQLVVDADALDQVLHLAEALAERIPGSLPPQPEALLALPGVLRIANERDAESAVGSDLPEHLREILAGFAEALDGLVRARREEGARLAALLIRQLDEIAALHARATTEAADQPALQRARLVESLQSLLRQANLTEGMLPAERIAQEVALLASRSDVREELDRLASHITAARALLAEAGPVGRRFDFLVQEFNREANTLCSKSASVALTATGLRLKAAIEQLREQVQNVE